MSNKVYLLDGNGGMKAMEEAPYEAEDILQELVALHPELLAGEQMTADAPRRWLLASREMAVGDDETNQARWSIDHLFLDQDAVPTLVEVKRSTDTRIRREVVGQMLDYAANAVLYWPVESIVTAYEATCAESGQDPGEVFRSTIGGIAEADFWEKVKTNLQAGRVRMIFLADRIPKELRRIVEFLNEQMDPAEVFAVEVSRYRGGEHSAVVPVLLGNTAEAQGRKKVGTRPARQWDRASFLATTRDRNDAKTAELAEALMAWGEANLGKLEWGRGVRDGSCYPGIENDGEIVWPFGLWTYGTVEINFQYLKGKRPFDDPAMREELRRRLNAIEGLRLPADGIERRPSFDLNKLSDESQRRVFFETFAWVKDEILDAKQGA